MTSLTIKNLPESLLRRLRVLAEVDDRSLNRQVIRLLEEAVLNRETGTDLASLQELSRRQAAAWRSLSGRWESDLSPEDEGTAIVNARTAGRPVEL